MHVHNGLHRITALQSAYKAALGEQTEDFTGIERAGETLTPIIDLWGRPEFAWLRDEHLWAGTNAGAAVVGELAQVAVVNALNSGMILIVEEVNFSSAAATTVGAGLLTRAQVVATLAAAAMANPLGLDNRASGLSVSVSGRTIPQVEFFTGTSPATFANPIEILAATSSAQVACRSLPVILKPGSAYYVESTTALNTALRVNMAGRIRRALPGEF